MTEIKYSFPLAVDEISNEGGVIRWIMPEHVQNREDAQGLIVRQTRMNVYAALTIKAGDMPPGTVNMQVVSELGQKAVTSAVLWFQGAAKGLGTSLRDPISTEDMHKFSDLTPEIQQAIDECKLAW